MPTSKQLEQKITKLASRYPATVVGVACKGTAIEAITFGAGKKVFLFMRVADGTFNLRLKLQESAAKAVQLGKKDPGYGIGANGWAKLVFDQASAPPMKLLERWIDESHRAVAKPAR